MKMVFADTGYWIALLDPQDTLHLKAVALSLDLSPDRIVTSEMIWIEVLNHFSQRGNLLRKAAIALIDNAEQNLMVEVVFQTHSLFRQALMLYQKRLDHGWSLTNCASFCIMQQRHLLDALAYDKHFEQAGFVALLREH
jgi:predicted nucleic acid-binding protein